MASNVESLKQSLLETSDGTVACKAILALAQAAAKGNVAAKTALAEYMAEGRIEHHRVTACSSLADLVDHRDADLAPLFKRGLSNASLRYWSIPGYLNILGRDAYPALVKLAANKKLPLDDRAHAIKCLARFSQQRFDRGLPADPGYWKADTLRLAELAAWAKAKYPDGPGYSPPQRHAALDKPRTVFEKIVSRLDGKLAGKRGEEQDLAAPAHWLAKADPNDLRPITARWKLPKIYLDFLTRFSPIQVTLATRRFYNHFQLFGAGELLAAQVGYSVHPKTNKPLRGWPAHLVVIASHGGDPFVLDLSQSTSAEAPVLTAEHGTGSWDFQAEAATFAEFLEKIAR